jgi:tRNA(Ile)-lysidine synthase
MNILYPQFKTAFGRFSFISDHATVLVAYSGGKDSTALLHLMRALKAERPLNLAAAYYNHGIRADAAREEAWVREQMSILGIPLFSAQGWIPQLLAENGGNLEEIASRERYRFLQDTLKTLPQPAFLATAHHAGDQLETFLFRLARGSGPQGLLGIAQQFLPNIIRPLLAFSPAQIAAFLQRNDIPSYHDSSNDSQLFSRNRIRHRILPELEALNPEFYQHFTRSLELMAEEDRYLQDCTQQTCDRLSPFPDALNRPGFLKLPLALQRRVLRLFITRTRGNLRSIELSHIESLRVAVNEGRRGAHLPGLELAISRDWITPIRGEASQYDLQIVGGVKKIRVSALSAVFSLSEVRELSTDMRNRSVTLPVENLRFPLTLRPPESTDRYRRQHTTFRQRVWEMLRERGIPPGLRSRFPLVINGDGEPIWCFGCPLAAPFHCPDQPRALVRLRFQGHPFTRFL